MATEFGAESNYFRSIRRIVFGMAVLFLLAIYAIWRIDNVRVERLRIAIIDRFVPSFEWTIKPVAATTRMISDLQSYKRVYEQNAELRRELQKMQGWREAALQLEQKNAKLLALNNVRLNPRRTFLTGEVIADSGSPFQRSSIINIGKADGVVDGSAAVDGLGLVGRIAGVAERSSRILFLNDGSSRVPAIVLPSGQRAIVVGDNRNAPVLDFLEQSDQIRFGDRVVSSGDSGLFPPDILIGQVGPNRDGRHRIELAADYSQLEFVRVVRIRPSESITGPGSLIGPVFPSAEEPRPVPAGEQAQ